MENDSDWHPLGAILYRKWAAYLYKDENAILNQTTKLEEYTICGAPYGGPIALVSLPASTTNGPPQRLILSTSSGLKLADVPLIHESGGPNAKGKVVIGVGWTNQEHFVTVIDDGAVVIYDIYGKAVTQFHLLDKNSTSCVSECHFWGDGVAVLTSDMSVFVAEGIAAHDIYSKRPRIYSLRTGLWTARSCTAMTVLPPLLSNSGYLEVLVATSDCSVLVVSESGSDGNSIEDQLLQQKIPSPITKISVAPNAKFLACYRKDGVLTVMSSAFNTKVLDFDTKSLSRPIEIAWCGDDSICLQWRNTGIVMVGPYGDWLNFPYDVPVHLVAEPDCCRIITCNGCEILQRVPSSTVSIRSVGSTEPAALLVDAMEAFDEGDPKSDENIRSLAASNQLVEAVSVCINAAAAEFDVKKQQSLMKAASYGKAFCTDTSPSNTSLPSSPSPSRRGPTNITLTSVTNDFVATAKKLRILNDVRHSSVGMPITVQQYNRLTPEVLVGRLTMKNHHFLALRICDSLTLKKERVLVHWACEKVKKMASAGSGPTNNNTNVVAVGGYTDEEINRAIKKQLEPFLPTCSISFLAIAEAAYGARRRRLATFILDNSSSGGGVNGSGNSAADQIPLLLKMNEDELALQKAINSEDTDLIYYTLICLEARAQNNPQIEYFHKLVHIHPEAANLLKIYYRSKVLVSDRSTLHNLLIHSKNYFEAGLAAANQGFVQTSLQNRVQYLKEAVTLFSQGKEKETAFAKTMTEEALELVDVQINIERRCQVKRDFQNLSVARTIYEMVSLSLDDPAEARWIEPEISKILKRFKVSDKQLWYMKIQAMSTKGEWQMLSKFANEKKSPVGYRAFAAACIKHDRPESEIEKYVEKMTDLEEKYESRFWRKAADVAAKLRDPYKLQDIGRLCQDSALERQIHEILSKL